MLVDKMWTFWFSVGRFPQYFFFCLHMVAHTSWKEFAPTRSSLAVSVGLFSMCCFTQAKIWPEDRTFRKCGQGFLTWVNSSVDIQWVSHRAARGNRRNQHTQQQQYILFQWQMTAKRGLSHIFRRICTVFTVHEISHPFRNLSQCQSEGSWCSKCLTWHLGVHWGSYP